MKAETILLAVAAFGAAGLLFYFGRRTSGGGGAVTASGANAGANQWTGQQGAQAAMTQDAINANWAALQQQVFSSQPDFWV